MLGRWDECLILVDEYNSQGVFLGHEDFKDRPVLDQQEPSVMAKNYGVFVCFLTHFSNGKYPNNLLVYYYSSDVLEKVPESSEGREESCVPSSSFRYYCITCILQHLFFLDETPLLGNQVAGKTFEKSVKKLNLCSMKIGVEVVYNIY